jgi:hypothetical protein
VETEQNKYLIKYLKELYEDSKINRKSASNLGIDYSGGNFTFSIDISGEQYFLTRNKLADKPDGVGDELAGEIVTWAKKQQ